MSDTTSEGMFKQLRVEIALRFIKKQYQRLGMRAVESKSFYIRNFLD